jgi:hypothetical protein
MPLRIEIISLLNENRLPDLVRLATDRPGSLRILLSLTYDKKAVLGWRAIEAVGLVAGEVARKDAGAVRGLVQRLLWMMRDESGNNPGSAPELLGEIVRNCPDEFPDIPPIIASFADEEMLRCGVISALIRIGEVRTDLVRPLSHFAGQWLRDENAVVRAQAVMFAGILGLREYVSEIESLQPDDSPVALYRDGTLKDLTLGKIAGRTVIIINKK